MEASLQIIVYAADQTERDYLRKVLTKGGRSILTFENDSVCLDNLSSINPDLMVIRTDSDSIVWRFVYTVYELQLRSSLVILSDVLADTMLPIPGGADQVRFISMQAERPTLNEFVDALIFRKDMALTVQTRNDLLVGRSNVVNELRSSLAVISSSLDPVLIHGERGVGKEHLSRILSKGDNADSVFIKIDCGKFALKMINGSIDNGDYTLNDEWQLIQKAGAPQKPITVLLSNIDALQKREQSELLLLIDEGFKYLNLNSKSDLEGTSVRFIATSTQNLEELVGLQEFKKELYYRLNVIPIHLVPLRQRKEDIPNLVDYFMIVACSRLQRSYIFPSSRSVERLLAYHWPGNLDELWQTAYRFAVSGDEDKILDYVDLNIEDRVSPEFLKQMFDADAMPRVSEIQTCIAGLGDQSLKTICDQFAFRAEKKLMQKALEATNWNRKKAAKMLNISYKSMLNKIKVYDII